MSSDPTHRVADAIRLATLRLERAFEAGEVAHIDASQLAETLLTIADELDPPLPRGGDARPVTEDA
jgi:hypothetical protein